MQAVNSGLSVNNKTKPKNQLFCRLDGLTPALRQEQRFTALEELGLMLGEAAPIFEEATQRAANFSGAPISVLGLVVKDELWFKSAVGLSTIDLTNQLASQRKIALAESFSTYVVDSQQPLSIANSLNEAVFTNSILTQHYGIKSYLGVPLITAAGLCLGTLEVMDWVEREFDDRDIDHLTLLARWCLGEFERERLLKTKSSQAVPQPNRPLWHSPEVIEESNNKLSVARGQAEDLDHGNSSSIELKLLSQLTQELKTPLTSVIGMASVLHREVYGPLTIKQREYLEIIHDSGQNLIALVDEIVNLGVLSDRALVLEPTTVDIEMLCQQVVNSLKDLTKQYQQGLSLSIEPGNRLWILDKEKIRQAVYYLIASVLEMSEPGGGIKIHVSQRDQALNIAVSTDHPWLGNDFNEAKLTCHAVTKALNIGQYSQLESPATAVGMVTPHRHRILTASALMMVIDEVDTIDRNTSKIPRDILGLLFCCHLTEVHQGKLVVQGSPNSGYRYLLQIPTHQPEDRSVKSS